MNMEAVKFVADDRGRRMPSDIYTSGIGQLSFDMAAGHRHFNGDLSLL